MIPRALVAALVSAVLCAVAVPSATVASATASDVLVSSGSPTAPFSQNKQNEPAMALDANPSSDGMVLAAGANDNIDMEACNAGNDTTCPFTPGVGVSGIYFSFDGGSTWTQPTYTGLSARSCTGTVGNSDPGCTATVGSIGTLPWYYENNIVSDGDPALAFGPQPDSGGNFSWDNGSRLYYANLTSNLSAKRSEAGFKGTEAVYVSRTDDPATAAEGGTSGKDAWMQPVEVTGNLNSASFADKEQIWADNASSSDFFGNVYVCYANYNGGPSAGSNTHTLELSRSTDGGDTWAGPVILQKNIGSESGKFAAISGASGCTIRTTSTGKVFVFWVGFDQLTKTQGIYMAKSSDGGASFTKATKLFSVHLPGEFDPVLGRFVLDGIAGARDDLAVAPSVDIANGAPDGSDKTNRIVMTYVSGSTSDPHAYFRESTSGGTSWSNPRAIETGSNDRPYYSAVAISPNGTDVYVVYNTFTKPYRDNTTDSRVLEGVVLHADVSGASTGTFAETHRGDPGDPRGSSQNNLVGEFLGDYVYAVATRTYGAAVWNDTRNAADCSAMDDWRMSLRTGTTVARPAPQQDCASNFGNSDIYGGAFTDPTP